MRRGPSLTPALLECPRWCGGHSHTWASCLSANANVSSGRTMRNQNLALVAAHHQQQKPARLGVFRTWRILSNQTTQRVVCSSSPSGREQNWCVQHFDPLFLGRQRRVSPPLDGIWFHRVCSSGAQSDDCLRRTPLAARPRLLQEALFLSPQISLSFLSGSVRAAVKRHAYLPRERENIADVFEDSTVGSTNARDKASSARDGSPASRRARQRPKAHSNENAKTLAAAEDKREPPPVQPTWRARARSGLGMERVRAPSEVGGRSAFRLYPIGWHSSVPLPSSRSPEDFLPALGVVQLFVLNVSPADTKTRFSLKVGI